MIKATLTKEIAVETSNASGTAAKFTHLIADQAKAHIETVWAAGQNGKGHFSLITDNNKKVLEVIKKDFPQSIEHEVVLLEGADAVKNIAEITDNLGQAGLNIDYFYTTSFHEHPAVIVSTSDNKKALSLLNHH